MLSIQSISKKYSNFHLKEINININQGEYFVLTGPSGAGKSILFEIIAGIIKADKGTILLNDANISNLEAQHRKIGLVFQDNTLFPHLTVKQNIAYPLKIKNLNHSEIAKKLSKIADEIGITKILNQKPSSLSGGEVQRVSIARALAADAKYLLLDEPLSSLDVQSKDEIRILLKSIHKEGRTILHITHDLREAFKLADRMAVMVNGQIIQCDKPLEICKAPASKFVADFIGFKNFYPVAQISKLNLHSAQIHNKINFVIIPEHAISVDAAADITIGNNGLLAEIKEITYFPDSVDLTLDMGVLIYKTLQLPNDLIDKLSEGTKVRVLIDSEKMIFL